MKQLWKVIAVSVMALAGIGVTGAALAVGSSTAQAPSHVASAAAIPNCRLSYVHQPVFFYVMVAQSDCHPSPGGQLTETCLQAATIYGWLIAPAVGNPNWGTACDTNDSGYSQIAEGNCLGGTWTYRTSGIANGSFYVGAFTKTQTC